MTKAEILNFQQEVMKLSNGPYKELMKEVARLAVVGFSSEEDDYRSQQDKLRPVIIVPKGADLTRGEPILREDPSGATVKYVESVETSAAIS